MVSEVQALAVMAASGFCWLVVVGVELLIASEGRVGPLACVPEERVGAFSSSDDEHSLIIASWTLLLVTTGVHKDTLPSLLKSG